MSDPFRSHRRPHRPSKAVRTLLSAALLALLAVAAVIACTTVNQGAPEPPFIAFEMPDGIHLINSDGSGERKLAGTRPGDHNPRWSPDGRKILLWNDRDAGGDIHVLDVESGRRRALTSDSEGSNEHPAWSPDGELIAFERTFGGATHI
jgi:Tol biopolymer transport system component